MSDKASTLVTTEYDAAIAAIDKLDFVGYAVTDMLTDDYQDSIVSGLQVIVNDSTAEIRQYVNAARDALLEAKTEQ